MSTNQLISLLDFLANKAGCMYLSDLRSINSTECRMLKRCIEEISADRFVAREWQDALEYLADTKTEETDPNILKLQLTEAPWNCRREGH